MCLCVCACVRACVCVCAYTRACVRTCVCGSVLYLPLIVGYQCMHEHYVMVQYIHMSLTPDLVRYVCAGTYVCTCTRFHTCKVAMWWVLI